MHPDEVQVGGVVSAEQWNRSVRLLKRRVTGPDVTEHSTGWHIARPPVVRSRTQLVVIVVITALPDIEDKSLTVRRVRYKNDPPVMGEYEWDGEDFEAFPDFGHTVVDYVDFFKVIETTPDTDDTFFVSFLHRDNAIVEFPTVMELVAETVVLTRLPTGLDTVLKVRKVKFQTSPPNPQLLDWDGDEFDAYPDFGQVVVDYALLFTSGTPFLGTTYFRLFQHKGDPIVEMPVGDSQVVFDTVVLTVRPTLSDRTLTVRKVQYIGSPPVQGEYIWVDQPFIVFPDFGHTAVDYNAFYKPVGAVPASIDTFLQLFQNRGDKILAFPATSRDTVVLTAKPIFSDRTLIVVKVRYVSSPPVQGEYAWVDQPYTVFPDFGHTAIDYAGFFKELGPEPASIDTFLRVFQDRGDLILAFPATSGGTAIRLRFRSMGLDHLVCVDDNNNAVLVAMQWLIRRTPFDGRVREGISYAYTHNDRRIATIGVTPDEETEIQEITQKFVYDDELWAEEPKTTGVEIGGEPIKLLMQSDGRSFAKVHE